MYVCVCEPASAIIDSLPASVLPSAAAVCPSVRPSVCLSVCLSIIGHRRTGSLRGRKGDGRGLMRRLTEPAEEEEEEREEEDQDRYPCHPSVGPVKTLLHLPGALTLHLYSATLLYSD